MKSRIGGMPYFFSNRVSVTNDSFQKLFYGVVIVPRRASFSNWSAVVGVVFLPLHCSHLLNFIFECAGGTNIFVLGHASYEPRPPLHRGGYPLPCCRLPSPGRPPQKKILPPVLLHLQPVPGFRLLVPPSSAPFPPAAALLLATISLNTYLANNEITHYRSFAAASGCSASILYPHRSRLRL